MTLAVRKQEWPGSITFVFPRFVNINKLSIPFQIQSLREQMIKWLAGLQYLSPGLDYKACTMYVVERCSANFAENCSEADSGRPWGSRGKFKTVQAF